MIIDLRLMAFATLWKKLEKKLNSEEVKNEIRNEKATYKFADYCEVARNNSPKTIYKKEGKIVEIDTTQIIKDYCKANDIEIIKQNRPNYKVTFIPSEKAKKEFNKMLDELKASQYKNIAKIADAVKKIK